MAHAYAKGSAIIRSDSEYVRELLIHAMQEFDSRENIYHPTYTLRSKTNKDAYLLFDATSDTGYIFSDNLIDHIKFITFFSFTSDQREVLEKCKWSIEYTYYEESLDVFSMTHNDVIVKHRKNNPHYKLKIEADAYKNYDMEYNVSNLMIYMNYSLQEATKFLVDYLLYDDYADGELSPFKVFGDISWIMRNQNCNSMEELIDIFSNDKDMEPLSDFLRNGFLSNLRYTLLGDNL